jgi:hypothetical protein
MEPAKLETTIGTLYVEAEGRDRFTIEGPFESAWTGARIARQRLSARRSHVRESARPMGDRADCF